jgi:cell division protein FtsN
VPTDAPAKTRVANVSAGRARSGGWTVQLGLFAQQSNAERLAHTAQSHGFAVQIARFGPRGLYRVGVTGIADRATAEQLSHRLQGAGLPAAILGPR